MGELIKSVLGGGWSLVVGWILPTVLNVLIFVYGVLPRLGTRNKYLNLSTDPLRDAAVILFLSATLGIMLAAIQTPIYRLLEGYVGWRPAGGSQNRWNWIRNPWAAVLACSHRRQLRRKQVMRLRLDLVGLEYKASKKRLTPELQARLNELRADPRLARYASRDIKRSETQLGLLREQVRRYPVSDQQVVPTRLGNAIRRLEEYGYDRFRLDSQRLWYELSAVAPAQAVKDVERSRIAVDFMVSLLAGHGLVAFLAIATIVSSPGGWIVLGLLAIVLMFFAIIWYRVAVTLTDDWAAAVRSLVNLGRKPLIEALALQTPTTLAQERKMWAATSRLFGLPYDSNSAEIDEHRPQVNDKCSCES